MKTVNLFCFVSFLRFCFAEVEINYEYCPYIFVSVLLFLVIGVLLSDCY